MEIEKDVPIPTRQRHRATWKRIAERMEIKDSVLLTDESSANSLRHALIRTGFKPSIRKTDQGWRVWRVA